MPWLRGRTRAHTNSRLSCFFWGRGAPNGGVLSEGSTWKDSQVTSKAFLESLHNTTPLCYR